MARLDPRQIGFDFTRAVVAAAAPADLPFTEEEKAAIACLPHGDGWQAFAAIGAVPEVIDLPVRMARWALVQITTTRIGVTSGYAIDLKQPIGAPGAMPGTGVLGAGGGGFLWANADDRGLYVWRDRDAAVRHGAHALWAWCSRAEAKLAMQTLKAIRQILGFDATLPPPEAAKRRLISRHEDLRRTRTLTPGEAAELAAYEARAEALQ